ncbi:hypothetical protein SLEP1_g55435 [Rubroshorea leprosula]|uniref:Uncharacterized protein n=1 Tax=Rubroshorea leprosula TaxID=152421 RepID=A0AAV5MJ80_9ROSI|nr:hypothetical protein SLEP1_g55435 [Rubroshorea leprosula]
MSDKRALTNFLRCVEWSDVQEAKQAIKLMVCCHSDLGCCIVALSLTRLNGIEKLIFLKENNVGTLMAPSGIHTNASQPFNRSALYDISNYK